MSARLDIERHDRVLVLTIANPAARNALDPGVYELGRSAIEEAGVSDQVGAVVLCGAGGVFSAGGNLGRLAANREKPEDVQRRATDALAGWVAAIRSCPKPVLAAVEGAAAGAGFALVLACDLVVAASDAVFSMAYVRVGLTPDGGSSVFLTRALSHQLAAELLFEGGRIGPQRLHALGIVNRVVEPGEALFETMDWAARLAEGPPAALARVKALLETSYGRPLDESLAIETDLFVQSTRHGEAGEGIAAFLEKRKPKFSGD